MQCPNFQIKLYSEVLGLRSSIHEFLVDTIQLITGPDFEHFPFSLLIMLLFPSRNRLIVLNSYSLCKTQLKLCLLFKSFLALFCPFNPQAMVADLCFSALCGVWYRLLLWWSAQAALKSQLHLNYCFVHFLNELHNLYGFCFPIKKMWVIKLTFKVVNEKMNVNMGA